MAPSTVSLTGNRDRGDDNKHDGDYKYSFVFVFHFHRFFLLKTTPVFRLPWIGRSFNIETYYFICYSAVEDCDGSRTVPVAAFHFQFEHSAANGILQTMRLKPGHVFDVGQLKLEVQPLVCYTGTVSVCAIPYKHFG